MIRRTIKHVLTGLGCVVCVLFIIGLIGPRVEIETEVQPVNLPPDLDQYLADSEAAFATIGSQRKRLRYWIYCPGVVFFI